MGTISQGLREFWRLEVVKLILIKNGAEIDAKNDAGKTTPSLHMVCWEQNLEVAEFAKDNDGKTPLYLACEEGDARYLDVVKLILLNRRASLDVDETTQGSPFYFQPPH